MIVTDNARKAKPNQLRSVTTIDARPRVLRQRGSSCRQRLVHPRMASAVKIGTERKITPLKTADMLDVQ
jgi:hypothetical protein